MNSYSHKITIATIVVGTLGLVAYYNFYNTTNTDDFKSTDTQKITTVVDEIVQGNALSENGAKMLTYIRTFFQ